MRALKENGRDNARTPMQWSSEPQAGFTKGTPWIEVNPNYTEVNAEKDLASDDSIYQYYKALISLRKQHKSIVYGEFCPLLEEHEDVFAYLRHLGEESLMVVANFSNKNQQVDLSQYNEFTQNILLSNGRGKLENLDSLMLQPYDAMVIQLT
ncbi:oligo-1,6-glucosidase [Vibrio maritimus]|uniref:Oligo-1,6-glucosidase n=1 Tax=Vibrio maritimus TaxID=990268 RepID=A0A090RR69_9VIBR|nr:oligo-1,6-glucosidase [Vibrio maritimus]